MIYVDSNVFISSFMSEDKKAQQCKTILAKISNNEITAFTSVLTWDEIVWSARKHLSIRDSLDEGKKFLEFPYLKVLDANEIIIKTSQDLMERYNLKPRDSIHAATMLINGIKQIISDDPDFDGIKKIKRIPTEKFK